jgi:hypothetical protein
MGFVPQPIEFNVKFSFFVEILCNDMKKWLKYVLYGGHQMDFVLQHVEFCVKFSFLLDFM